MRQVLFLLLLFTVQMSYGQGKNIRIPVYQQKDTSYWYKEYHSLVKQVHLQDLETQPDTFHFRFWTDKQAIGIWTKDYQVYYGYVTNFARKYNDKLLSKHITKIEKVFSNHVALDTARARQLYNLLVNFSIVAIPSDDEIKDWSQGFDGEEYIIEVSSANSYTFKTYWTPRIQPDTLKEARQIQLLADTLFNDFKIRGYYKKLKLPAGRYLYNGVMGIQIINMIPGPSGSSSIYDFL